MEAAAQDRAGWRQVVCGLRFTGSKKAVPISFFRALFHVFFGRPLFLWPCGVHCMLVWQRCHCFFSESVQASSIFLLAMSVWSPDQFV